MAAARLYAITPDAAPESIEQLVAAWLRGGVDVVQLGRIICICKVALRVGNR